LQSMRLVRTCVVGHVGGCVTGRKIIIGAVHIALLALVRPFNMHASPRIRVRIGVVLFRNDNGPVIVPVIVIPIIVQLVLISSPVDTRPIIPRAIQPLVVKIEPKASLKLCCTEQVIAPPIKSP